MSDPFSTPKAALKSMLLASDGFQAFAGGDFASRIHLFELLDADLDNVRPFAVIYTESLDAELVAGGAAHHLRNNGAVTLHLSGPRNIALSIDEDGTAFEELVGAVWQDLIDAAAVDENLVIDAVSVVIPPQMESPNDRGVSAHWDTVWTFTWK